MILLLLVSNLAIFEARILEVSRFLRVPVPRVSLQGAKEKSGGVAWVNYCTPSTSYGCNQTVYIYRPALEKSREMGLRFFAYHEVCHLKVGVLHPKRLSDEELEDLERRAEACTVDVIQALHPGGWKQFSRWFPCGDYNPAQIIRDHKRRGIRCAQN